MTYNELAKAAKTPNLTPAVLAIRARAQAKRAAEAAAKAAK
jgi:hypothetical protein